MHRIWQSLKHFRPEEFHRPDKLNPDALRLLDAMRDSVDGEVIVTINADYAESGHTPNSWHYKGRAFDLVIRDAKTHEPLPVIKQFLIAVRFNWGGIGVYPFWRSPGLHLDNRPLSLTDRRAMWWRNEEGKYRPIEEFFAMKIPSYGGIENAQGIS